MPSGSARLVSAWPSSCAMWVNQVWRAPIRSAHATACSSVRGLDAACDAARKAPRNLNLRAGQNCLGNCAHISQVGRAAETEAQICQFPMLQRNRRRIDAVDWLFSPAAVQCHPCDAWDRSLSAKTCNRKRAAKSRPFPPKHREGIGPPSRAFVSSAAASRPCPGCDRHVRACRRPHRRGTS